MKIKYKKLIRDLKESMEETELVTRDRLNDTAAAIHRLQSEMHDVDRLTQVVDKHEKRGVEWGQAFDKVQRTWGSSFNQLERLADDYAAQSRTRDDEIKEEIHRLWGKLKSLTVMVGKLRNETKAVKRKAPPKKKAVKRKASSRRKVTKKKR